MFLYSSINILVEYVTLRHPTKKVEVIPKVLFKFPFDSNIQKNVKRIHIGQLIKTIT